MCLKDLKSGLIAFRNCKTKSQFSAAHNNHLPSFSTLLTQGISKELPRTDFNTEENFHRSLGWLRLVQGNIQWKFQDPKMEVLYHIRPYFVGIFPYIGLNFRPYIW